LAPDSADGRFALGRALFHNEQFAAALPELQAALRTEPRMKEAFALLGRAYLKLGRSQEAKAALQRFDELSRAESQNAEARPDAATPPKQ